jgi:hypothetical protein
VRQSINGDDATGTLAGSQTARSATPIKSAGILVKTTASHALTPNKKPTMNRARANAATMAMVTPKAHCRTGITIESQIEDVADDADNFPHWFPFAIQASLTGCYPGDR